MAAQEGLAIRSFIAVAVPPEAAGKLRAAQERLRAAEPDLKWVAADTFHITLKFLGPVAQDRLEQTWQSVCEALNGANAFTMRFRGVGAFPNQRRPRVVWVGVTEGAEQLVRLAERVVEACQRHGFEPENRPFQAHLTVGRAREPKPNPALADAMAELVEAELGEVRVDRVLLMKSQLTPRGAIYDVLEEKPLTGLAKRSNGETQPEGL
jgi:2'-5' RNA ligase